MVAKFWYPQFSTSNGTRIGIGPIEGMSKGEVTPSATGSFLVGVCCLPACILYSSQEPSSHNFFKDLLLIPVEKYLNKHSFSIIGGKTFCHCQNILCPIYFFRYIHMFNVLRSLTCSLSEKENYAQ